MRSRTILLSLAALLTLGSMSRAEDKQPFIGVLLDGTTLPELLTKHLGLEPGQGLRIVNISVGSAAEKAGLERDDILIGFQGQEVKDLDEFIETVKKAGVGARVSLEVIHLGQRKTVELQLEPLGEMKWKYPSEPEAIMSWRPGKVFKIGPDGQQWLEIPFEKLPDFNLDINSFFKEKYTYEYSDNGESYTVTIEGSPTDEDTKIVVQAGETEHSTTVGQIDSLPQKYRESAKQAVESANKNVHITGKFRLPEPPRPEAYRKFFRDLPRPDLDRLSEESDRALERLQEQMERLQQRMQKLEERHRDMLDKLLKRKDDAEPKSDKTDSSTSSVNQENPSV
ncbi:MAG: PDZ domain-containing protein [Sedimentisphaerales bacterium]|nr:PDZ domain-containing protein [Sedimentisphaerales bacterium]